jgi:hypothetical protein
MSGPLGVACHPGHPSTPREWLVRPGRVVVSSPSFIKSSVVPRHLSLFHPWPASRAVAHEARVGGALLSVVHHRHLSFPCHLLFVVPLVVCCRCHRMALVHPQSTQQAVARQHGGGCSVICCCHPRCCHSSLFVVVVPVCHVCCPHLSLSFVVVCHCCHSFIVIVCPSIPIIPCPPLFFVVCHPSPHSTRSPPHEQLLVRLVAGGGVIVGAGGSRFEVGGEGVIGRWGVVVGLVCVVTCHCQ